MVLTTVHRDNARMIPGDVTLEHYWLEAQAAVQADTVRDVVEEAQGLAEAELADMSWRHLVIDSLGALVTISQRSEQWCGHLTAVTQDGEWLVLDKARVVRTSSISAISGVHYRANPLPHERASREHVPPCSTTRQVHPSLSSILRSVVGSRVQIQSRGAVHGGRLHYVHSDFMTLGSACGVQAIPYAAVDALLVVDTP